MFISNVKLYVQRETISLNIIIDTAIDMMDKITMILNYPINNNDFFNDSE